MLAPALFFPKSDADAPILPFLHFPHFFHFIHFLSLPPCGLTKQTKSTK
jgi:hypothetical protein